MRLGIVFKEEQTVPQAQLPYPVGVRTPAVQVYEHYCFGAPCDVPFYLCVIYLQRLHRRFHEYGLEFILGYGEDGGDIGVCRHYDLVTIA